MTRVEARHPFPHKVFLYFSQIFHCPLPIPENLFYSRQNLTDTIVALATPPGAGAIAVVRLSGKDAIHLCNAVFKGKNLLKQKSHTIHYGILINDAGKTVDEVLVSLFVAPRSYTKENVVEISCHGSTFIQAEIVRLFLKKGARLAQPGEFTLRAFLNGQMDLSQAEAVADLIAADSAAAHDLALRQMRGGYSEQIKKLRQELIRFASLVELELDFGEENVEFANRDQLRALVDHLQAALAPLIQSFALGNAIKNGVATVIAGRPNAGKSTLLNALLNEDRAIVSEIPGTTRDTIEDILQIGGVPFRLIDTAGIREATDAIESLGVQRSLDAVRDAALLLYVFDLADTTLADVHADLSRLVAPGIPYLVICNKMDLVPVYHPEWLLAPDDPAIPAFFAGPAPAVNDVGLQPEQIISLSARNRQNIDWLKENLLTAVDAHRLNSQSVVVSAARHYEALQKASASLAAVRASIDGGLTHDIFAMDIRQALYFLGEITGEVAADDLLENIFRNFCIGK